MEIKKSLHTAWERLKKYRHAVLIVVVGLALMVLPGISNRETAKPETPTLKEESPAIELQLAQLLSQLDGAGQVQVMLSLEEGEQIRYQTDIDNSDSGDVSSKRETTVTVNDSSRNETGLIRQVIPPQYRGAIVICSGADNPAVRLAVVDAVSKITGLGTNRISVLKMK